MPKIDCLEGGKGGLGGPNGPIGPYRTLGRVPIGQGSRQAPGSL